ncbi:MAG: ribonuclease P protein component [Bacteroidetes bacterium]|nr:ribonuclease P protein component [Bacteroidota bacterium]
MKKYGLSAQEKIKSRKEFETIYQLGKTIHSSNNTIKANYIVDIEEQYPGVEIAVAVSRKSGNAVWRNKLKRLLRESYRINKTDLLNLCSVNKKKVRVVFSTGTFNQREYKKLKLNDVLPGVIEIIEMIKGSI